MFYLIQEIGLSRSTKEGQSGNMSFFSLLKFHPSKQATVITWEIDLVRVSKIIVCAWVSSAPCVSTHAKFDISN